MNKELDLIDRNELEKILQSMVPKENENNLVSLEKVIEKLKEVPTVDSEPIRHGKWLEGADGSCMCSECGKVVRYTIGYYCPNCGAKMEGEQIWLI